MNLGDLLDELRRNVLRDRSDLSEGAEDFLWSDETLVRYIKDGERRFARRTLCLRDATTPECTQIVLKEGVRDYPLHKSVIGVLSAKYDTDTFDLQRSGHALVYQFTPPEFLTYDPSVGYNPQPGRPVAFFTDETLVFARQGKTTISMYPMPSALEADKKIYMRVIRVPNSLYSLEQMDEESEIPEDFQLDCLEWAAHRAQRHFDADAGAIVPSDRHKLAFDAAIEDAIKALKRTMFANMTVQYGQNGFSYVR